jgi:hypothetical protein
MAENLLETISHDIAESEEHLSNEIAEAVKTLLKTLQGELNEQTNAIDESMDAKQCILEERLSRIEAFLGMDTNKEEADPEPIKNGKAPKPDKGPFCIKAWDGEDARWYGGRKGNRVIWSKSPKSAKRFETRTEASEVADDSIAVDQEYDIEEIS